MEEAQVREEICDLLLPEVPAAGRAIRREREPAELLLVDLGIRAGGEEHDDLARYGLAGVDQLAHPRRNRPGLAATPVLTAVAVARLVGDEELDRMAEDRVRELGGRGERLEVVPERPGEQVVHGGEHLRARPVVAPQAQEIRRLLAALPEDLDVRVPEAVDRLELVADREHLGRVRMRRRGR